MTWPKAFFLSILTLCLTGVAVVLVIYAPGLIEAAGKFVGLLLFVLFLLFVAARLG